MSEDTTSELLVQAVTDNQKLMRAARKFLKWYNAYTPYWDDERCCANEFYDLQEAADAVRVALLGVRA
jgi:hypothetical protein